MSRDYVRESKRMRWYNHELAREMPRQRGHVLKSHMTLRTFSAKSFRVADRCKQNVPESIHQKRDQIDLLVSFNVLLIINFVPATMFADKLSGKG